MLLILACGCAQQPQIVMDIDKYISTHKTKGTVILLHGLWRDSKAMEPMETYLTEKGLKVHNINYPSDKYPIEDLVQKYLHPVVNAIRKEDPSEKLHFVTHSLGGILVRYYLKNYSVQNLGNVVMLSPPNQGSELSDLTTSISVKWPGPAGGQLSTEESSWVRNLGEVNFTLGIIAGNFSTNWITSWMINGQDDGVVAVNDTKVEGMTDFLVVPEKHFRIRKLPIAMQQTIYFLQNGKFYRRFKHATSIIKETE